MNEPVIVLLSVNDSPAVSRMFTGNSAQYQKYFYPFSFDETTIRGILSKAKMDKYWGVWIGEELAAVFYLRGFDEGYTVPCYGVCVAEEFAGQGILKQTLQYCIDWCENNKSDRLMLKVDPANKVAKRVYEKFGFVAEGVDPGNNNIIYYRDIAK